MFALLIITNSQLGAQLDAADGYASIYGDNGKSSLAFKMPSVPWGSHAKDHGILWCTVLVLAPRVRRAQVKPNTCSSRTDSAAFFSLANM